MAGAVQEVHGGSHDYDAVSLSGCYTERLINSKHQHEAYIDSTTRAECVNTNVKESAHNLFEPIPDIALWWASSLR